MKRTKQAAAVVTALALAATMAVPVWATTVKIDNNTTETAGVRSETYDVNGTYEPAEIIHLDIEWGDMKLTYAPGEWNPEYSDKNGKELVYVGKDSGWNNKEEHNKIVLTNRSNANVKVTFEYDSSDEYVSGDFYAKKDDTETIYTTKIETDKGIWMQSADANITGVAVGTNATDQNPDAQNDQTGIAPVADIKLILTGRPQKRYDDSQIGEITVNVQSVDYNTVPAENSTEYSKVYKQPTT